MNARKLAKIQVDIDACQNKPNRHRDLERIALALGRTRVSRGKEPAYVSAVFKTHPITIPDHAGRDIKRGTAKGILSQLEEDVARWEQRLKDEEGYIDENSGYEN